MRSLPPYARIGQARAALEALCRQLTDEGCQAHELRMALQSVGLLFEIAERYEPTLRRAAVEVWMSGAPLEDALSAVKRRKNGARP